MNPIPNDGFALILGAMRSGTTSLYDHLVGHPQLCPCVVKEPEFFSTQQAHRFTAAARYEELWKFDAQQHRYALEGSTGYTKFPIETGVPEKIRALGLNPRFIYLVRDPFARIESHFNFMRQFPGFDLAQPLTAERFVTVSDYHCQLARFLECFPRERFLVLDFDDLKTNPAAVVKRCFEFLEIDSAYAPPSFTARNEMPRVTGYDQWRLQRRTAPGRALADAMRPLVNIFSRPAPQRRLTAAERETIHQALAPGMRRLQSEFGVAVARWGF